MGKIVLLSDYRPHTAGKARCLDCRHEFEAVAAIGATWLECPQCGLMRGRYIYGVERSDPHWKCDCGNTLFSIYYSQSGSAVVCNNCGVHQTGWDDL
jgi:hypothetical protein